MTDMVNCKRCHGTGTIEHRLGIPCSSCDGQGVVEFEPPAKLTTKPLSLIVTKDGVPFEDQHEGLRLFKEQASHAHLNPAPPALSPDEAIAAEPDPEKRLELLTRRVEILVDALRRTNDHLHGFADYHPEDCTAETEAIFFTNSLIITGQFVP